MEKFGKMHKGFSPSEAATRFVGGKATECTVGTYLREFQLPKPAPVIPIAELTGEAPASLT